MATRQEILGFLKLFKGSVMLGRLSVKDRQKNRQALISLGLSPSDRSEELMALEPEDYVAGPKPDDTDHTKEVWEFGKSVEGTGVYIKLRVVRDPKKKGVYHALVWSFHPAEFPLKHPLRGGGS